MPRQLSWPERQKQSRLGLFDEPANKSDVEVIAEQYNEAIAEPYTAAQKARTEEIERRRHDHRGKPTKTGTPRDIECPVCHAKPGQVCKRPSGHAVFNGDFHAPRKKGYTAEQIKGTDKDQDAIAAAHTRARKDFGLELDDVVEFIDGTNDETITGQVVSILSDPFRIGIETNEGTRKFELQVGDDGELEIAHRTWSTEAALSALGEHLADKEGAASGGLEPEAATPDPDKQAPEPTPPVPSSMPRPLSPSRAKHKERKMEALEQLARELGNDQVRFEPRKYKKPDWKRIAETAAALLNAYHERLGGVYPRSKDNAAVGRIGNEIHAFREALIASGDHGHKAADAPYILTTAKCFVVQVSGPSGESTPPSPEPTIDDQQDKRDAALLGMSIPEPEPEDDDDDEFVIAL